MSEFKTIETQEELDNIVKSRISREREKYADYETLKSRVSELEEENNGLKVALDTTKQESTDFNSQIADLQSKISGYETASLKAKIALQNGLPYDLAERLQGNDEEELKADAERLAGFIKPVEPVAPLRNNEPPIDSQDMQLKQMLRNMKQGE